MAELIPRYIALGREKRYLRYVPEEGKLHSRMQLISDCNKAVMSERSSLTKLELVCAESISSEEGALLVHIRSCYNKKFLVLSTEVENWVVAKAYEPVEDRSDWSCTLFRLGGTPQGLRLFLQSGGAEHGVLIDPEENCLTIARNSRSAMDFRVTEVASLFKEDNNQPYLAASNTLLCKRLGFNSTNKLNHKSYVLPNSSGCRKTLTYNQLGRKAVNDFMWCESNGSQTGSKGSSIVFSKNIGHNYKLNNNVEARIYDVRTTSNWSQANAVVEKQLRFTYDKMSGAESITPSQVKLCVEMTAMVCVMGQVGKIGLDTTHQGWVQWSETKETPEEISLFVTVGVPPMTKVEVTMVIDKPSIAALPCKL